MDSFSGGAGDDTISGLVGVSGTFGVGDTIVGGAGTDTLNLLVQSGGQSQLVTLSGVENVNARLLEAGPASALALNAIDWAGVTTLSFNNSLDETAIRVSGITTSTTINVNNEVDVSVDFRALTSATDTVNLVLTTAGSGGGTAASLTSAGVADINLDLDGVGLIDAVNIALTGKNYAVIEAGADNKSIKFTGNGGGVFSTDDEITSLDASALTSGIDFTFSGVSNISIIGGAGNDTFRMRTSLNLYDTIVGGDGTDGITFTVAGSTLKPNITTVENATATFGQAAGGTIDATSMSMTSYDIKASAAGNDGSIINLDSGVTVKLTDGNLDDLEIDTKSGASALTLKVGSAGTSVTVGDLTVTDVSSLTVEGVGSGTNVVDALLANDADIKTITINAGGGEAELTLSSATAAGVTTLALAANGSAALTLDSDNALLAGASAITSMTVTASGSGADITIADLFGSAIALATYTVNGTAAADITVGDIVLGNATGQNTHTETITMGSGSVYLGSGVNATGQNVTLGLTTESSGIIRIGTATIANAGSGSAAVLTINAAVGTGGEIEVSGIAMSGGSADLVLGTLTVAASGTLDIASGAGVVFGAGGSDSTGRVSDIGITIGQGADASIGAIAVASGSGKLGNVTLSLAIGASADLGAVTLASATLGVGNVGEYNITVAGGNDSNGTAAAVDIHEVTAARVGAITISVNGTGDVTFDQLAATGGSVGDITISAATGATVTVGSGTTSTAGIAASAIGAVTVSGAGTVVLGNVTATTVRGDIDVSQMASAGSFTVNLAGVTNGVTVNGGNGTLVVQSSIGNDTFNLKSAAGTDTIRFGATGQAADVVYNFEMGTGGDTIGLSVTALDMLNGSGDAIDASAAAAVDVTVITGGTGGTSLAATDNIIVLKATAFASLAEMVSSISKTAGDHALDLVAGASSDEAGGIVVVWSDGTDSYVSLVEMANASAGILNDASANTLVTLSNLDITDAGVTAIAANFAFFTL